MRNNKSVKIERRIVSSAVPFHLSPFDPSIHPIPSCCALSPCFQLRQVKNGAQNPHSFYGAIISGGCFAFVTGWLKTVFHGRLCRRILRLRNSYRTEKARFLVYRSHFDFQWLTYHLIFQHENIRLPL